MWVKLWERSQMTPQTKATFAHSIQVAIASLPPAQAAAIREKAGAAWLQISQAPSIAWIDEEPYNALTGAAREVLGDSAMRELFPEALIANRDRFVLTVGIIMVIVACCSMACLYALLWASAASKSPGLGLVASMCSRTRFTRAASTRSSGGW